MRLLRCKQTVSYKQVELVMIQEQFDWLSSKWAAESRLSSLKSKDTDC